MNHIIRMIIIVLACLMSFKVSPALSQNEYVESEWTGKLKDGTVITYLDLRKILKNHERLQEIDEKGLKALEEGRIDDLRSLRIEAESTFHPANLAGADLRGVDLSEFNLVGANLEGANLAEANLYGTYLRGTNLSRANLAGANLTGSYFNSSAFGNLFFNSAVMNGADLTGANLSEAKLWMVNLSGAKLTGSILRKTDLSYTDLTGAEMRNTDLTGAKLTGANLENADLSGSQMDGADLSLAKFLDANLHMASLKGADLSNSSLRRTKLISVNLQEADLTHANLIHADLRLANLFNADLRGALLIETDFANAILYNTKFMGDGLLELNLTKPMMSHRDSRRLNACYIRLVEWAALATESGFYNIIKSLFNLMFLELTGQYGLKPGRPLIILLCFIPYFALFYIFALRTKDRKTGVWLILPREHASKKAIKARSFKLTSKFPPRPLPAGVFNKIWFKISCWDRMIRIGIYFSLLSAFNIGWQEINTRTFLTRMQRRNYTLTATGWVRSLSGIQSLISIFLLVLWALTTFGHTF